jgi:hypothetical protein
LDAFLVSYDYQEKGGLKHIKAYVTEQILLSGNAALQHPINGRFCPLYLEITFDGAPKRKTVLRLVGYEEWPRKVIQRYVDEVRRGRWGFGK